MGNTDSKQKLGEKVTAAKKELEENVKIYSAKANELNTKSKKISGYMIENISKCFKHCSPFSEATLLTAWHSNPGKCEEIVLKSCEKVLNAPITADQWQWFQSYVFPSSIWMYQSTQNRNMFMYEKLLDIANSYSGDIMQNMDDIYDSLAYQKGWKELMSIKNEERVSRQDDVKVGCLKEDAIRELLDTKSDEDYDMQTFVDSNWCVTSLLSTAKEINKEFQDHIRTIISHFGDFKPGPLKQMNRCQSKLENDYSEAVFPKAAKLLDIVRCSVTFNTVKQLIKGYQGLMNHMKSSAGKDLEIARVKNGFLNKDDKGYRDVKINVIYHSPITGLKIICEIQLLLINYLYEKKKVHKLYNVIRQKLYFNLVVSEEQKMEKQIQDLELVPVFNFKEDVTKDVLNDNLFKCSMDSETNLLGVRGFLWFGCVSLNTKKIIFEQKVKGGCYFSHHWINVNGRKCLTVQTDTNVIKMYEVNNNIFKEDKKMEIRVDKKEKINLVEFDKNYKNVLIIKNKKILEQRAMDDIKNVKMKIELTEAIGDTLDKLLCLSDSGQYCVVAGGMGKKYFYFIDLKKQSQHKFETSLEDTFAPCFINGESKYVLVGDRKGKIEIWDMETKALHKTFHEFTTYIGCAVSTNNILAVAAWDQSLKLWDVRNWEMFYSTSFHMDPTSLHLTPDAKYLTIGGQYGKQCIVWKIQ